MEEGQTMQWPKEKCNGRQNTTQKIKDLETQNTKHQE
jgi:hypothetical protein